MRRACVTGAYEFIILFLDLCCSSLLDTLLDHVESQSAAVCIRASVVLLLNLTDKVPRPRQVPWLLLVRRVDSV